MEIRLLTDELAVSPQISPPDLATIAEAGYCSVICNRPDGEEPGQPDFAGIEQSAADAGLEIRWIPVSGGMFGTDTLDTFRTALEELPKPILAYCRTGTRCTMLWAISQHGERDSADIIKCAAKAGYDVMALVRQLDGS